MSTRQDLQARLQNQFSNTIYYDQQAVMDSLQDGVDEVCAFTGCIYKSAAIPFTQYTTYYDMLSLLPDYIGIVAMWLKPGAPSYGRMLVYYRAAAPTLTDQTPIPIPDEYQTAVELYSIADLWEQAQEWGKASEGLQDYIKNLEALRVLMRNKREVGRTPGLK